MKTCDKTPSIVASDEEFYALAEVLGEFGVGHIGLTLGFGLTSEERQAVRALTAQMMRRSGRPFHLLDVQLGEDLAWLQSCRAAGLPLVLQLLCTPGGSNFKLSEYNLYDYRVFCPPPGICGALHIRGGGQKTRGRDTPNECHMPRLRHRPDGSQSRCGVKTPDRGHFARTRRRGDSYRGHRATCARLAGLFGAP